MGRELFFSEAGTLVTVRVGTLPEFAVASVSRLFSHSALIGSEWEANYDVSADGQRILLPEKVEASGERRMIHVVQNWFAELRSKYN